MEIILPEIITYGGLGILAGVLFFLLVDERKAHAITRQQLLDSNSARLDDSKQSVTKVTDTLGALAMGVQAISDKIEVARGAK